jgi:hypothetical protein
MWLKVWSQQLDISSAASARQIIYPYNGLAAISTAEQSELEQHAQG